MRKNTKQWIRSLRRKPESIFTLTTSTNFKLRFMEANLYIRKWRTNNNEQKDKLEIIESQENVHSSELIQKSSIEKIETDNNCSITNRKVLGIEWEEQNDILK